MTDHTSTTQLIVIRSKEEYLKTLKASAEMYLYDLREELSFCKGHHFISEIPEPVLIKIEELAKVLDDYLKP
jgi:hypothetical protein